MDPQKIYHSIHNGSPEFPASFSPWKGKVLIVGAGIAGITTAHILRKQGVDVQILEASNRYGGRIWSVYDFYEYPIELGAEEVHGTQSAWYEFIKAQDKSLLNYDSYYEEIYCIDGVLRGEHLAEQDPDFQKLLRFSDEMYQFYPDADTTLSEAIQKYGISPRVRHLIEAWLSAEYGTSTHKINLQDLIDISKKWQAGERNFVFTQDAYSSVLDEVFEETLADILFNKVIQRIDYSAAQPYIITQAGEKFTADKIVVTVPLGILKSGMIQFIPNLPSEKIIAIHNLGIDAGLKIILKFKSSFWEEEMGVIYGNGLIGEFYTSAKDDTPILTAYILGDSARKLSQMGDNAIAFALQELDNMMGQQTASQLFEDAIIVDWWKEPYIQGAYSYPVKNGHKYRQALAKDVDRKIFFAGEASNYHGHPATVHGALETGFRAAFEVLTPDDELFIDHDISVRAKI